MYFMTNGISWNSSQIGPINVEKTDGAIKNGQSRDTGDIGYKTQNEDKQNEKHNTGN